MNNGTIIAIIIISVFFAFFYFNYLMADEIWRIFVFVVGIFLLTLVLIWFIEKNYPNSNTGKKLIDILKKVKNIVKELIP